MSRPAGVAGRAAGSGSVVEDIRTALPLWGFPVDCAVSLLNRSENTTFRIDPPDGRLAVLRLHRPAYHRIEEIRSELAWIAALRRDGAVDTPAPLAGVDGHVVQVVRTAGGDRHAAVFAFAPGAEPPIDGDLPAWFERLGQVTARLHRHAARWHPPTGFVRKTWDWDSMFGASPVWGDWRAAVGLDRAGADVLGRALALIRSRLGRFGRAPERFGLIHADLRLANLLVDGEDLRVIDFDDCGFGWRLYDFAAAVSFFETDPIVDDLREAWLAGYRTELPLPDADAAELPVFVATRRLLLTAWIASHPEVAIAQQLGVGYTRGTVDLADRLLSTFG